MIRIRTSRVLARYGQWVVTTYGIENTRVPYVIEKERLEESDWPAHVDESKGAWYQPDLFRLAYEAACRIHRRSPNRERTRISSLPKDAGQ